MIYQGGPDGRREIARSRGRDEIIGGIIAGWERTAATWYPGSMIHQIGSVLAEPAGDGRIRCRSYASILALDAAGAPVLQGLLHLRRHLGARRGGVAARLPRDRYVRLRAVAMTCAGYGGLSSRRTASIACPA